MPLRGELMATESQRILSGSIAEEECESGFSGIPIKRIGCLLEFNPVK